MLEAVCTFLRRRVQLSSSGAQVFELRGSLCKQVLSCLLPAPLKASGINPESFVGSCIFAARQRTREALLEQTPERVDGSSVHLHCAAIHFGGKVKGAAGMIAFSVKQAVVVTQPGVASCPVGDQSCTLPLGIVRLHVLEKAFDPSSAFGGRLTLAESKSKGHLVDVDDTSLNEGALCKQCV